MSNAPFVPMSEPVRAIFSRLYLRLDNGSQYFTAYMLAETETDLGDYSRPVASIARKRVMDRSDAPTWRITHADQDGTFIAAMDSRLTIKGTENHIKRAIAEFLYARELEKAAKARENKAAFKSWFGACRKLATETHIEHARDIGSIDIGATRLVYAINYSDAHGNEHADWRNGIRRMGRIPYRSEMINDMLALRSVKGRDYRRLLIQEMSQRRRTGMLAPIPGKPNARAFTVAEIKKGRDVAPIASVGTSLFSAEALAELSAIEGINVMVMSPDNVADVHNTIAEHIGEPSAAFYMADKLDEPSAAELRGMRLFNCQTEGREPYWRNYKGLELAACRNDKEAVQEEGGNPEIDTHIVTCHYEEAEFFSVYLRDKEGLAEALTDIQDRDTVLAIVAELMAISGLPCEFANVFGWR